MKQLILSKVGETVRSILQHSLLYPIVRALKRQLTSSTAQSVSYGHQVIAPEQINANLMHGWKSSTIPEKQRAIVNAELQQMYGGDIIPIFHAAAEAVQTTGLQNPFIIDVGCASGYYSEVLGHLLGYSIRYIGLDYSEALLRQAKQYYPQVPFLATDATKLPLTDNCCDLLFSSALLMHIPTYEQAIKEFVRISRGWCIFHRTPVVSALATTHLSKYAYSVPVVEIVFNEQDFLTKLKQAGLEVTATLLTGEHPIAELGNHLLRMKTFICRKTPI